MRIGIFTDAYLPHISGVTTSITVLRDSLQELGHDVFVVTSNLENMKFVYDEKEKIIHMPGIKTGIYETRLTNVYSGKAMKIIKSWNLDVIHSQTEFGIGTFSRIVAKKLKLPVVHTYHTLYEDYVYYVTHGHFDNWGKKLAIKITKYFCDKKCDELIVPTQKIKDLFVDKYHIMHSVNVLPTGIDLKKFKLNDSMKKEIEELRKKFGIKKDDFVIGSVGRVAKEKNFDEFIECSKHLIDNNSKIKLCLVGDGPYLDELKAKVKELDIENNVIFAGRTVYESIPTFYNMFSIIVSFSTTETQGLTIIEGLAASKPTICIDDPSFRLVIENNYNGYLFKSHEEYYDKVNELISDNKLYKEMSLNAFNSTYKFSKEVFGAEILKIYKRAIENKKKQ